MVSYQVWTNVLRLTYKRQLGQRGKMKYQPTNCLADPRRQPPFSCRWADGLLNNSGGSHRRLLSPKDICRWRKFFGGHVRALLQKLRNQHKGEAKGVKDTVSGILKENENEKPGSCGIHNSLNDKILNYQRDDNHGLAQACRCFRMGSCGHDRDTLLHCRASVENLPTCRAKSLEKEKPPDRRKVVKEEVEEWLKSGRVNRVQYPMLVPSYCVIFDLGPLS
nr:hypothetical protein [Tanacetum cinerariifolium]